MTSAELHYSKRAAFYLSKMQNAKMTVGRIVGAQIGSCPDVFNPFVSVSSAQFAAWVGANCVNRSVYDIGTGTGVLGIVAALHQARSVLMTDINPAACACALENLARNKLDTRAAVKMAPGVLPEGYRFDLVLFAAPYLWFTPPSRLLRKYGDLAWSMFDPDDRAKLELLASARHLLSSGGRLAMQLGSMSRLDLITQEAELLGFYVVEQIKAADGREDNIILVFSLPRVRGH